MQRAMAKTNKYYPVRAPAAAVKQGRNRGPTVTQRRIVEAAEADKTRAATRAARAAKAPSKAQQLLQKGYPYTLPILIKNPTPLTS